LPGASLSRSRVFRLSRKFTGRRSGPERRDKPEGGPAAHIETRRTPAPTRPDDEEREERAPQDEALMDALNVERRR
jgi:hypothetical protein